MTFTLRIFPLIVVEIVPVLMEKIIWPWKSKFPQEQYTNMYGYMSISPSPHHSTGCGRTFHLTNFSLLKNTSCQWHNYINNTHQKGTNFQVTMLLPPLGKGRFWRTRRKCEKFTTTKTTTDKLWSEKLIWAFGSGALKMKYRQIYFKESLIFASL